MNRTTRREFLKNVSVSAVGAASIIAGFNRVAAAGTRKRKMTMDLVCGNIGVSANQREAIELAARHGFESVGVDGGFIASLSAEQLSELKASMESKGLVFGAAGLPVEFRQDQAKFEESLKALPKIAGGLKRAG